MLRIVLGTALFGMVSMAAWANNPENAAAVRRMDVISPVIETSVTCVNPFEWTLGLSIWDDRELASYAIQLQGFFGLTSLVAVDPGQQLAEMELNAGVGESYLILATDMDGNAAKALVTVPPDYCGCQNCTWQESAAGGPAH